MYRAIFFSLAILYGLNILLEIIHKTQMVSLHLFCILCSLSGCWLAECSNSLWAPCDEMISFIAPLIQSALPRKSSDGAVIKLKGTPSCVNKRTSCCEANVVRRHFSCFSQWLFSFVLIFLTDKDQIITPKIHPSRLHLQVRVVDGQMHKESLLSFSWTILSCHTYCIK